jgi:hypothetical protein
MIQPDETLEADYVIVGAGAMGMAFADAMLTASDATMIIVDRRHRPGGHWNNGYPFVRLHGAPSLYGVNSRPFGDGPRDRTGLNAGHEPLPSGAEICAYYDETMRQRLLPSGRVTYLPMCDHADDGTVVSRVSGGRFSVSARKALVDGTYSDTKLPSTDPPAFDVAPYATCIAPNALPAIRSAPDGYTIVGAGKTAMDSVLWLLENGVAPEQIRWIRPRDPWTVDRAGRQFDPEGIAATMAFLAAEAESAAAARSFPELFERLEAAGALMRIDPQVRPSMYRCATLSRAELAELRHVTDIIRVGHVTRIGPDEIVLEHGAVPTSADHVHVNCTAPGLRDTSNRPVFADGRITLQMVRTCQPSFSGAIIARIQTLIDGDDRKNAMTKPVPPPNDDTDWARLLIANAANQHQWSKEVALSAWIAESRLDGTAGVTPRTDEDAAMLSAARQRMRDAIGPAVASLQRLLAGTPHQDEIAANPERSAANATN